MKRFENFRGPLATKKQYKMYLLALIICVAVPNEVSLDIIKFDMAMQYMNN